MDIAVGLGLHPNFETAVSEMSHLGRTFEPNPANHRLYDELYRRVYKRMYAALRPLYEEIRAITGYPPTD
jgi:sugar (pentulose or hexulose) kinase